jgi:hypothetical protein
VSSTDDLNARVTFLETELVALNIKTRHLLTVVGQLTAYADFQRGVPREEREEMQGVLDALNVDLKTQRGRLPHDAFTRIMERGL